MAANDLIINLRGSCGEALRDGWVDYVMYIYIGIGTVAFIKVILVHIANELELQIGSSVSMFTEYTTN